MSELGRIELDADDGHTAVVALIGAIDLAVSQKLQRTLADLISPNVVIDMRETTFIDSITIGALVAARQSGRVLTLRGLHGAPLAALDRSGVTGLFEQPT